MQLLVSSKADLRLDQDKPPLILSRGRSGSSLLTYDIFHLITNKNVSKIIEANSNDFLKTAVTDEPIHSHYLHPAEDIAKFTCFFSLRKNPVETILSFVLATHYNVWNLWRYEVPGVVRRLTFDAEPFLFDAWRSIDTHCWTLIRWCNHYATMLNPNHQVVYYENYVKNVPANHDRKQVYPDKKRLIINYDQVEDYILKFKDSMLSAQAPFAELANCTEPTLGHVVVNG